MVIRRNDRIEREPSRGTNTFVAIVLCAVAGLAGSACGGTAPPLDASATADSAFADATVDTALDVSIDGPALDDPRDSPAVDVPAPDAIALDAIALDAIALDARALDVQAVDVPTLDAIAPDVTDAGRLPDAMLSPGDPCTSSFPVLHTGVYVSPTSTGSGACTLVVGGATRRYWLHVPPNFVPGVSALVLVLHQSGGVLPGNPMGIEAVTDFSHKADQIGFAVAYPLGIANATGVVTWNAYYGDTGFTPPAPDDAGFLRSLVVSLQTRLRTNPGHTFIAGFSAGALMAHRAGIDLGDIVSAIGVNSGSVLNLRSGDTSGRVPPTAAQPVSVLMLHGSNDMNVPFCGATTPYTTWPLDRSFDYWATTVGRCATVTPVGAFCASGSPTSVSSRHGAGCVSGVSVVAYQIFSAGHQWFPTIASTAGARPYNTEITAATGTGSTDLFWNFFAAHHR